MIYSTSSDEPFRGKHGYHEKLTHLQSFIVDCSGTDGEAFVTLAGAAAAVQAEDLVLISGGIFINK
ncbi:MAG: hypothetical protein K9I85_16145 [Saprospiraceae bacterium]|nr:hypothetical protein [Saprospiraceae bacterium]